MAPTRELNPKGRLICHDPEVAGSKLWGAASQPCKVTLTRRRLRRRLSPRRYVASARALRNSGWVRYFVGIALIDIAAHRARNWALEAFAMLVLAGVVRESGAIPSFGDAYLDLLGAFVPFTLAALCLAALLWSRGAVESSPARHVG